MIDRPRIEQEVPDHVARIRALAETLAADIEAFRVRTGDSGEEEARRLIERAQEIRLELENYMRDPQAMESYGVDRMKLSQNLHPFSEEQLQAGAAIAEKVHATWNDALGIMEEMRNEAGRIARRSRNARG